MNAAPDMITAGLKMAAALGAVLALILCLLYGLRKMTGQRLQAGGGKRIRIVENQYMGVKKSIALVQVPGKVLVLGITADRINLLETLDEAIVETHPAADEAPSFGSLFGDRLKKIGLKHKGRNAS